MRFKQKISLVRAERGDFTDINLRFPHENEDSRLDAYEIVYGIDVNNKFKAYKRPDLDEKTKKLLFDSGETAAMNYLQKQKTYHALTYHALRSRL